MTPLFSNISSVDTSLMRGPLEQEHFVKRDDDENSSLVTAETFSIELDEGLLTSSYKVSITDTTTSIRLPFHTFYIFIQGR